MKKITFKHPAVYGDTILFFIIGLIVILIAFPDFSYALSTRDYIWLLAIIAVTIFIFYFLYSVTLHQVAFYKEYDRIFQSNNIQTIEDIVSLTGRSKRDIAYDFYELAFKKGVVSPEVFVLIPTLKTALINNKLECHDLSLLDHDPQNANLNSSTPHSNSYDPLVENLQKLASLHQNGHITSEEYEKAKRNLINK